MTWPLSERLKADYEDNVEVQPGNTMAGMLASFGPGLTVAHVHLLLEIIQRLDALEDLAKPRVFIQEPK